MGSTAYQNTVIAKAAPEALYMCQEASGNPQDSSGNARHTIAASGLGYHATGPFTGAFAITTAGAATATIPSSVSVPQGSHVTIGGWQKVATGNPNHVFNLIGSGNDRCRLDCPHDDGNIYWDFLQGNDFTNGRESISYGPYFNGWVFVVVRSSSNPVLAREIFINATSVAAGLTSNNTPAGAVTGGTFGVNPDGSSTSSLFGWFVSRKYLSNADITAINAAASAPIATGYTLSQPSPGIAGAPSSVTLTATPSGAYFDGSTTLTLTPSGTGGSTLTTTPLGTSATVSYTPASAGTATLTATNNGGLSNPTAVTFTVYGAPTGEVRFLGTQYGSGSYQGDAQYAFGKVFDKDDSTFYVGADANAFVGIDLGAGVQAVPKRIRLAPRPSTNDGVPVEDGAQSFTFDGSTTGQNTGLTHIYTANPAFPFIVRNQLTEFVLTNSAAYQQLQWTSLGGSGNWAELEVCGLWAPGLVYQPDAPTISPAGGYGPRVTVVIASKTTSSPLYFTFTTDGTTPPDPTSNSTRYTGPNTFIPTTAGLRIKAIAIDPAALNPSDITSSGVIYSRPTVANGDMYDDRGILIEAHDGFILTDHLTGKYYWYGQGMNRSDQGDNVLGYGTNCYSSADGQVWHFERQVCGLFGGVYIERPRVGYNVSTSKYVMWVHPYGNAISGTVAWVLTSDTPTFDTFTVANTNVDVNGTGYEDSYLFVRSDGVAFLVSTPTARDGMYITELNSDWTDVTTNTLHITGASNRESPQMFELDDGTIVLLTCAPDFFDSTIATDVRAIYCTGDPLTLANWTSYPGVPFYLVDPLGTPSNAQPTCVFKAFSGARVLLADSWGTSSRYGSRYVLSTITINFNSTVSGKTQAVGWPFDDGLAPITPVFPKRTFAFAMGKRPKRRTGNGKRPARRF